MPETGRTTTRFTKDPRFKLVTSLAAMYILLMAMLMGVTVLIISVVSGAPNGAAALLAAIGALGLITNGVSAWRNRKAFGGTTQSEG